MQTVVLHIKVYGYFSLVCNYLTQFYHKRSNLDLLLKKIQQDEKSFYQRADLRTL